MDLAESHLKRVRFIKDGLIEGKYSVRMQINDVMVTVNVEKVHRR